MLAHSLKFALKNFEQHTYILFCDKTRLQMVLILNGLNSGYLIHSVRPECTKWTQISTLAAAESRYPPAEA